MVSNKFPSDAEFPKTAKRRNLILTCIFNDTPTFKAVYFERAFWSTILILTRPGHLLHSRRVTIVTCHDNANVARIKRGLLATPPPRKVGPYSVFYSFKLIMDSFFESTIKIRKQFAPTFPSPTTLFHQKSILDYSNRRPEQPPPPRNSPSLNKPKIWNFLKCSSGKAPPLEIKYFPLIFGIRI